jgi:hypothetical protein
MGRIILIILLILALALPVSAQVIIRHPSGGLTINIPGIGPVHIWHKQPTGSTETYFAVDYFASGYFQ